MRNTKIGNILIYTTLSITFFLWALAKNSVNEVVSYPFVSLNQIAALLGTTLFVWSMVLATRLDFLENLFGGLDKVYKVHRKVSEVGAVLIFTHPIFLAISSPRIGLNYFLPVHAKNPINIGVYSFWLFLITILLTLFIKKINLPYHIWKQTHKFLNLAMILTLLHVAMIPSDTSLFPPLGIWMKVLVALGVASGLYITFFYKHMGPKYKYEIVKINRYQDIHDVYLKPIGHKLVHKIAQYAYVSFISKGISKETHPYCISSLPEDNLLRFSIKELGDYTKKLNNLRVGGGAIVHGPYGHLGQKFEAINIDSASEDSIFIAGGIGVAPFLSMFKKAGLRKDRSQTSLFYCTKFKKEASFGAELEKLSSSNKGLQYLNQCSRDPGGSHLSIDQILKVTRAIDKTNVYLCGPTKMMMQLKKELIGAGFSNQNIILEDFEMI